MAFQSETVTKTSKRKLIIKITGVVFVLLAAASYIIYGDHTVPPKLSSAFFADLSLSQSAEEIARATVDGGVPGVIILIRRNGLDTIATAGVANKRTGSPIQHNTPLRIASVSKVYTAAVVLSLAEQGLIDLDAAIASYLDPDIINGLSNAKLATVRQLLLHTAGIPDYYDLRSYFLQDWSQPITLQRTLPVAKRGSANFAAGERFEYSNMGYILLGEIAEEVSGKSLNDLIEETVIQPLGFKQSYYNVQHPSEKGIHGYGTIMRPWVDTYDLWEHSGPDGGMMASASETARFLEALTFDTGILSSIGNTMLEETVVSASRRHQGLGLETITARDGEVLIGHTGDVFGYQTVAFSHPESKTVFVAHINCDCSAVSASLIANLYRATKATAMQ